ncbi:MAG: vanadium-dependent haloperoxidase [Bacteroidia bacterium]|nr:vanadium-dependent haloperoxidase [Bacteroidia bacterium]
MKKSLRLFTIFSLFAALILCSACEKVNPNFQEEASDPAFLHETMKKMTDIMVYDIFSPPVASRNYVYPAIAAYEAMVHTEDNYQTLAGQLHELEALPQPNPEEEYCYPLASFQAATIVGKALIFSEDRMEAFRAEKLAGFQEIGMPKKVYDRSMAFGQSIADHILSYADGDNYKQTRTFPKYSLSNDITKWTPTPPDYMDAIEPSWNEIRTFVLDSANQYVPLPPTEFDMDKNSRWYKEVIEVYDVVKNATEEESEIASFWDCNPYVSHHKGHVMFATKKITPGGHWVGISRIACEKTDASMMRSAEVYAMVTIALADAFISCWDEKYRSKLLRPETFINQYIDEDWVPLLQTPPFPEHTSGHSVISSAAGETLTYLFGDNFAYTDDVEVEYGLPERSFGSFREAYAEAAVSRLYGGIHYMPAIEYGVEQGKNVGAFILENIQLSMDKSMSSK